MKIGKQSKHGGVHAVGMQGVRRTVRLVCERFIVFARLRQCALPPNNSCLGRCQVFLPPQMASQSLQPFLQGFQCCAKHTTRYTDYGTCIIGTNRPHLCNDKTSCYSNGSDNPHRRRRVVHSVVFTRWRQCGVKILQVARGSSDIRRVLLQ